MTSKTKDPKRVSTYAITEETFLALQAKAKRDKTPANAVIEAALRQFLGLKEAAK